MSAATTNSGSSLDTPYASQGDSASDAKAPVPSGAKAAASSDTKVAEASDAKATDASGAKAPDASGADPSGAQGFYKKIWLGFNKITGTAGGKASGMLMVGGVLYMWMRNADGDGHNCRLGWSTDHASTWTFSTWTMNLGYCSFINYGQNYAGARDGFVYTVSHNSNDAYLVADDMVLAPSSCLGICNL